jgi:uncharacterized lipoprotein YmbA
MTMLPEYLSSRLPVALGIGMALALSACASDPVNFHTLVVPAHAQPAVPTPAMDIRVEPVTVPPQVDRTQIVIRQGRSGLQVLETEWWGATLADEIHSALRDQLNPPPAVSPTTSGTASLQIDVQRFDSVLGEYALLDVKWRLKAQGKNGEKRCHTVLRTPAGETLETLVNAHQNNLTRLAALIAEASHGRQRSCAGG